MNGTPKGLMLSVYRSAGVEAPAMDCTNGGITAKARAVIMVDAIVPAIFNVDEEHPGVKLHTRTFGDRKYHCLVPVEEGPEGAIGPMFGGNYAMTSDSRFPFDYPLPIHDRYETQEEYDRFSR